MESDLQQHHHFVHDHQLQHHQKQLNSGLTRYQSAPSAYFSSFLDREFCEDFLNRPASPETERIFARFLSNANIGNNNNNNNNTLLDENPKMMESVEPKTQIMQTMNNQAGLMQQSYYQSQAQQNLQQNQSSGSEMDYRVMSSVGLDPFASQMKMSSNNSNLIRHRSSPAGIFNNIKIENGHQISPKGKKRVSSSKICKFHPLEYEKNGKFLLANGTGYVVMKGMGDYGTGARGNINTNREASFASSGRPPTGSKPMSPVAEIRNQTNNSGFSEGHGNNFPVDFPMDPWDDSSMMSENLGGVKRLGEDDRTLSGLSAAETQNMDPGTRPPSLLAHHLSLPKDITTIEKLLQYQDSVPCKIRAKRGCATHPRSIAERVRRTKISERMRKLQELVPNMDKQTNTADMLDLAVDYVKELQKQVKELSDNRGRCTCSSHQQQQQP